MAQHRHELTSYARYCIRRERAALPHDRWTIELAQSPAGWTCTARIDGPNGVVEARVEARESSHATRGAIQRAAERHRALHAARTHRPSGIAYAPRWRDTIASGG